MKPLTRETYDNIAQCKYYPAEIIAAIGDELRRTERYKAKEMRECIVGIRMFIERFVDYETTNAQRRSDYLTAPLEKE